MKKGRRVTKAAIKTMQDLKMKKFAISEEDLEGKVIAKAIPDPKTGEIIAESNSDLTKDVLRKVKAAGVKEMKLIFFDGLTVGPYLRNTLLIDKVTSKEEAVMEIYKRLRPGEPPTGDAECFL